MTNLLKNYNINNLCLAGGVALNCVANGRLQREGPFRKIWIQPAAGDAGGALGCALSAWYEYADQARLTQFGSDHMRGGYLGPRFANPEVRSSLEAMDANYEELDDVILLTSGAVMSGDETVDSPRVSETAGPWGSVAYHAFLEQNDQRLETLPNAQQFRELVEQVPEDERHLHVHSGHLTHLNDIDREVVVGDSMFLSPFTLPEAEVKARIDELESQGITEIAYQPMGDIEREMRTFASAAGLT